MPAEPNDSTKYLPLRAGRTDPAFDQLQPGQAKIAPMADDQPFTQPGVPPGSGDGGGGPTGGGVAVRAVVIVSGSPTTTTITVATT